MNASGTLSDRTQFVIFVLWFVLCCAVAWAEEAPALVPAKNLEQRLQQEQERVRKLNEQLSLIEAMPLPNAKLQAQEAPKGQPAAAPAPTAVPATGSAPVPKEEALSVTPVPGCGEALANSLYQIGRYKEARDLYQQMIDSAVKGEAHAWARLQSGNCLRQLRDYVGAVAAYEQLINETPTSPWAQEATWWMAELKWWLVWNETMKQQSGPVAGLPR